MGIGINVSYSMSANCSSMRSNNYHLGNGGVNHQEEDGQEPDIDLDVPLDDGGVQGRDDTGTVRFIYI